MQDNEVDQDEFDVLQKPPMPEQDTENMPGIRKRTDEFGDLVGNRPVEKIGRVLVRCLSQRVLKHAADAR